MDQTQPQGAVSEDAAIMQRMQNYLGQSQDPAAEVDEQTKPAPSVAAEAQPSEQPASPASEEVTPDDIPDETPAVAQPAVDAFEIEIVHDGQPRKLNREDTIKYARQGFDYTQKTQRLAEQDRQVNAHLRALAEVQQVQPYLMQERAQVAAFEQQLAQYQNFNWVQLAQNDPLAYPAARAQYDVLTQAHQQAMRAYQGKEGAVKQQLDRVRQERVQSEYARIPELIPAWTDKAKRDAGEAELVKHYETTYGVPPGELANFLGGSALAMSVAYKAQKYDQLVKNKANKDKQLRTAPPVTVPGAKPVTAKADEQRNLTEKLRKTGDMKDAAALLLNRWK
jgi:Holliday junction resolvasome RuvABC endonuclease subunit